MVLTTRGRIPRYPRSESRMGVRLTCSHRGHFRQRSACRKGAKPAEDVAIKKCWTSAIDETDEKESALDIRSKKIAKGDNSTDGKTVSQEHNIMVVKPNNGISPKFRCQRQQEMVFR